MALTDESTGMVMPVSPMYGNSNGGWGDGFGSGWWIILLFILLGNNGWGGFGGGFGGAGELYPWMNNSQNINSGFRDQMINDNITSIRDGMYGISNQLCNGFAGTTAAVTGAQNALAQQLYTNQIADMERSYAAQTASTAGMTALQAQLAQCCCDNRAATADLKYTVATENCADRTAAAQNTRDIIDSQTRGTQAILDKLCALEMDGYKRENENLRQQLNMASLAASQNAQTAAIQAGQRALANEVEQYVVPTPRPAYIVQNPNCCAPNYGCGCGA